MRRRRLGLFLTVGAVLMSLAVVFVGCDWFSDDDEEGGKTSKYVMVANTNSDSISVFKIASDGVLTSVDNVDLAPGSAPTHIALTPNGKFLYIVNSTAKNDSWDDNASIGAYTYNSSTGAVTEIAGSPFTVPPDEGGTIGTFIHEAITPNGKFLYVTDQSRFLVHGFRIQDNGVLTYLASVDSDDVHGIAMHPKGKFLFAGSESDFITSFAIADNGALTEVDAADVTGTYVELAVTPNGKYLFGAGNSDGAMLGIADNGALSILFNESVGGDIKTLAITPNGKYLYAPVWSDNSVYSAIINYSDVGVDNVVGSPFGYAGKNPKSVAVTRNSRYLYVANYGSSDVTAFDILSGGVLDYYDTYPLPVGAGPKFIVTLP
ncbi:MAG: lactonase family protein [Desulfobacteria bacterium]